MINRNLLVTVLCVLLTPLVANSTPITYFYTGPTLSAETGVPAGVSGIMGSFSVDLPASNSDPFAPFSLLDYDLTDGLSFFDPASIDYKLTASLFLTNDGGEITSFLLQIFWDPFNTVEHPWTVGSAGFLEIRFNWFGENLSTVIYCTTEGPDGTCFGPAQASSTEQGTLEIVAVPEPDTLVLFGTALLALALMRRRKMPGSAHNSR